LQRERSSDSLIDKEDAMKMRTFILAGTAFVVLGAGAANSGPCTSEIDAFAKTLAAKDAGSGHTPGASAATPPVAQPSGQHPPSAIMGQETEGKAASPEDVRRQTAGQSPAAQQGTTGAAADTSTTAASEKLSQARALDQQGKEAECMEAMRQAKQLHRPQ
jgi:hypothetical protein